MNLFTAAINPSSWYGGFMVEAAAAVDIDSSLESVKLDFMFPQR